VSALAACGSPSDTPLPKTAYGPEGMAVQHAAPLAPAPALDGRPVSGVPCRKPEKPAYHVHTHLAVYVEGKLRSVPGAVGMVDPRSRQTRTGAKFYGPTCYYDLHTHAQDGVIHIEGPEKRDYTLGQFFSEWGVPLTATQVGTNRGAVTVFVNGKRTDQSPADIVLAQREVVQVDVGAVVPPAPVDWSHF
jgi:hypothetical protein